MELDEAESVILDMEKQGLVPDVFIYTELIRGYYKSGNLYKALALHGDMISRGIKTNCVIDSQEDQKNHGDEKVRKSSEDSSSTIEKEKGSESGIPHKDQDQGKGIPQDDEKNDKNQKKTSEEGKASLQKDQFLKTSEKKEKRQMGVQNQSDKVTEEWNHGNAVSSESTSIGKGFKDTANSASEAVTRLANRFSEEDKQKQLLCAGATVLVVAVGI
ncbi:hypothetical protein K1719_024645 [Acacia pycnantha]|nr:hypothetical protein K1719_024645 [Acacia pycnantha]